MSGGRLEVAWDPGLRAERSQNNIEINARVRNTLKILQNKGKITTAWQLSHIQKRGCTSAMEITCKLLRHGAVLLPIVRREDRDTVEQL